MKNLVIVETVTVNSQVIEFKSAGDEIYTDSLTVARVFEKSHKNVLQSIDVSISGLKNQLATKGNTGYVENTYLDAQGKTRKIYYMTKKAFTFLVMGFNGAKANQFKIQYIDAFETIVESHRGLTQDFQKLEAEKALLVEEVLRLKNYAENTHRLLPVIRKESDGVRRDNFKYISDYFTVNGTSRAVFKTFQSNMYEDIYLVVTGTVARNIVLSRFEEGIQSFNSSHKTPHTADYNIAYNFLRQPEMVLFMSIYEELCRDAVIAIDENPQLTPDILSETVDMKLKARIKERRGLNKGDEIARPDKVMANNLVEKTVRGYLPLCEFKDRRHSLKAGKPYKL